MGWNKFMLLELLTESALYVLIWFLSNNTQKQDKPIGPRYEYVRAKKST